jgi:hypothetical protein
MKISYGFDKKTAEGNVDGKDKVVGKILMLLGPS